MGLSSFQIQSQKAFTKRRLTNNCSMKMMPSANSCNNKRSADRECNELWWARRMTPCKRSLLEDFDIDNLTRKHMTITKVSRRAHFHRGFSMPVLRHPTPSGSVRRAGGEIFGENIPDQDFLPLRLPRYSQSVIVNREDMESHLEAFRARISAQLENNNDDDDHDHGNDCSSSLNGDTLASILGDSVPSIENEITGGDEYFR